MASLYKDYPLSSQNQIEHLILAVKDWTIAHGLAVRPPAQFLSASQDPQGVGAIPAPVTLFPSLFPRICFEEATAIQQAYNELYAKISIDEAWLGGIVQELAEVDSFIQGLWQIHQKVKRDGYVQPLQLGLFRSDYMVNVGSDAIPQIKQVEFNTISSSFGGLSMQVSALHKHLHNTQLYSEETYLTNASLPENNATTALAEGLAIAHNTYASATKEDYPLCILFVVQEPERNIFDQRFLEYALQAKSISVFRVPFVKVMESVSVSNDAYRRLLYVPPHATATAKYEVSLVYLRSTYTPTDFPSQAEWDARYHLERSAAIKCPSILAHLAGSKKVQQVLATPHSPSLERFLDKDKADRVRKSFAAIYPLDDSEAGKEAKLLATDPLKSNKYVLKPQREGGGNNVYRKAIPPFLKSLGNEDKWKGYILMELIEPPPQKNSIFRSGELATGEVIAELGVFGTCLWNSNGQVAHNSNAGYLLRTKGSESEEGGVAAGFGAIDSVCLVDI